VSTEHEAFHYPIFSSFLLSLRMSSERAQFMNTFSLCLALTVRNQVSHPYNTIVKRENMNIYTHFK